MRAAVFNTDASGGIVEYDPANGVAFLQEAVGGIFDAINLRTLGVTMWINDEGKLLGLPINPFGSMFWAAEFGAETDVIVGNIVITGLPDGEGNTTDLSDFFVEGLRGAQHAFEECPVVDEELKEIVGE